MLDLNVMKDLLVGEILVPLRKEHGKCFAQLKEDAPDSKLRTVRIFDVSPGSILINLDKYQQPRTLLRNEKGQRQRCDYVLLTTWQKQPLMLFVEMKSKVAKDPGIQKQFKGAECVMDYCNAVLNRFHQQNDLLSPFLKRFVVFYKPTIAKRPTRLSGPARKNDSPENAYKYPDPINPP